MSFEIKVLLTKAPAKVSSAYAALSALDEPIVRVREGLIQPFEYPHVKVFMRIKSTGSQVDKWRERMRDCLPLIFLDGWFGRFEFRLIK